jgi:protein translocase SecG subunit
MALLIGFLTFILVVNCLFLMLLILIQLPKKEAGAGIAFGGAATDALFGAGSGNALTKVTKYAASMFVVMSVVLSVLNTHAAKQGSKRLEQELNKQAGTATRVLPPVSRTSPTTTTPPAQTTPAVMSNVLTTTLTNQTVAPAAKPAQAEAPVTPPPPAPTPPPAASATNATAPAGPAK